MVVRCDTPRRAVRRSVRPRSRARHGVIASLVAMALVGACERRGGSATPNDVAVKSPRGDADAGGKLDPKLADPREHSGVPDAPVEAAVETKPRERPSPVEVADREAALGAVVRGNPDGGVAWLRTHVAAKPKDTTARIALARGLVATGNLDEATKVLEDAKGAPLDVEVVQIRVALLRQRSQLKQAEALLDEAVRKHPKAVALVGDQIALRVDTGRRDDPKTRALIDAMYDAYDAGKVETAAELLAVAIAAHARGGKGGYHDANMVLEAAEALEPVDAGSWIGDRVRLLRGNVFLEKYASDEAATTFEMLLGRDPWHPEALVGMAQVHLDQLRLAAAARTASEALQVDPHNADAHAALARVALIEGRHAELETHIRDEALVRSPGHVRSLAVVAAQAIAEGDTKAYEAAHARVLADNPRGGAFFRDLSEILVFLHLYPEADAALAEAVKLAPGDPHNQSAYGLNLLRLGDEEAGRAALAKAWKGDPFNERTRNVLDLYEKRLDKHYGVATSGALTVRLPTEDREFVEPVLLGMAQKSLTALDAHYKTSTGKLRLEFFADADEFSVRTVGVPSLGAVAVCFGPVITFIGPYHGRVNLDLVMRHEMAHVYAIRRSKGRVPRWFTEGLSEWESEQADPAWARESAALLTSAREAGKLRKISELELAFIRAESSVMMEAAYATAAYAIRYLAATYGRPKLIAILDGYGAGKHTPELFAEHFGKSEAEIDREFDAWFAAELAAKHSGWMPDPNGGDDPRDALWRTAGEQLQKDERDEAVRTLEKLVASDGDGFAPRMGLAEILMQGKDPKLAKRHLEAARKFSVESTEPLVKLAELARQAGDVDEEKRVLRAALAIDADSFDPAGRLLMLAAVTDDRDSLAYASARTAGLAPLHPISLAARALTLATSGKAPAAKAHVARAKTALENTEGRGPADTFVVLALAQRAIGDDAGAKATIAKLAKAPLPKVARRKLGLE
jgi:tetratricopeptide (TPR) repeat protein